MIGVIAAGIFVMGIVVVGIVLVSVGIHQEEWEFQRTGQVSLTRRTRGPIRFAVRYLIGLHVRRYHDAGEARPTRRGTCV